MQRLGAAGTRSEPLGYRLDVSGHVFLIPGFFGFANLGGMRYFGPVVEHLERALPDVAIHVVPTHPTASLKVRSARVYTAAAATEGPIHLIGHSSGGLDARILATPGAEFPDIHDVERVASRIRSVVSVATPHYGTPSAEFFNTLAGKRVLRVLSAVTILTLRHGGAPLALMLQLADLVKRGSDRVVQSDPAMFDHVFDELLGQMSPERRDQVSSFFKEVGENQGLLPQIVPDAIELLNTTAPDRADVRYGSVITRARRPGLTASLRAGWTAPAQAAYATFILVHTLAGRLPGWPPIPDEHRSALREKWPERLEPSDNDGMVPTVSQPWGEIIRCVDADHLDVLGHYGDPSHDPPRYDWFTTGTGYGSEHFEATWNDVAHFIEGA